MKWKEDQLLRELRRRKINVQDEMWRFFTNVPTISGRKKTNGKIHRRGDI